MERRLRVTLPIPENHPQHPSPRPQSPRCVRTRPTRVAPPIRTTEWDAFAAVREATAGALQALAVMLSFVIFGVGWAVLSQVH